MGMQKNPEQMSKARTKSHTVEKIKKTNFEHDIFLNKTELENSQIYENHCYIFVHKY